MKTTFLDQTIWYVGNAKKFNKEDIAVYITWIGLMLGLLFSTGGFIGFGLWHGVHFPAYAFNVVIGTFIFTCAIAVDTIGHRTVYKEALKNGESLVHHMTIFAGITSCVGLCLCYSYPDAFTIPTMVFVGMSVLYSVIDEWMHWVRYMNGKSDPVEMWSHFFIFVGHNIFVASWVYWYFKGYEGVAQTLAFLK